MKTILNKKDLDFDSLIRTIKYPLIILDKENFIQAANDEAEMFFGISRNILNKYKFSSLYPDTSPLFYLINQSRENGNTIREYSLNITNPINQITHEVDIQVSPFEESDYLLLIIIERGIAKKFKNIKVTDDAQIIELNNLKINTVINTSDNFKITTLEDYMRFRDIKEINNSTIRVGIGFDVHKFKPGKVLRLFGVNIPYTKSLEGHSDADVGLHAITDSIYGALGLEDIGFYFNPNNSKWKNADSKLFLADALNKLNDNLGLINNIDIVVICEEPKINLHRTVIKNKLSELLSIPITRISVKATTTEKLGFTGRKEGIAVQAIVNIGIRNQRYE